MVSGEVQAAFVNPSLGCAMSGEVDEEQILCRICRVGDEDGPLIRPCLCSGSIAFVHADCLEAWLKFSGRGKTCELCDTRFSFRPGTI